MQKNQRVEIRDGVLQGAKGTVTPQPQSGKHEDKGFVWVVFDNPNDRIELSPQWFEKSVG